MVVLMVISITQFSAQKMNLNLLLSKVHKYAQDLT